MPQVSVLVPTKDRPLYLAEAVASVLVQTNVSLELLIINDGTTPIANFGDARIRVLDNKSRGAVSARNLGVKSTRAPFIAFLDDDDRWIDAGFLAQCVGLLRDVDFVFGDGIMQFPNEAKPRPFARDADEHSLAHDNTILVSTICYHRSLHDTLGRFDEALPYYWDWDWYLRVARSGARLKRIAHPVADIRIHAQNMSGQSTFVARRDNLKVFSTKHGLGDLQLKNHTDFV